MDLQWHQDLAKIIVTWIGVGALCLVIIAVVVMAIISMVLWVKSNRK